jgi:multiple sugar transport system ATP-binding protein
MAKLKLENLYKRYEHKSKKKNLPKNDFAVNNLNLDCEEGEFVALLGPSGCGKTTTLRMIAGLEDITDGNIYIGDVLINDLHPKDRNIGLAFEDYALYPPLKVYENIAFNMRARGAKQEEVDQRVMEIAPLLKVEDLLDKMPVKLSGGQKQRVNIARAMVRNPRLLLMDEPLSHLDGKMRQELRTEIKRLHNKIKCTTVYVTHDQLEAMSLADRIAIMDLGVLQQVGTPMEIYDDPVNEFVAAFIGEPPMNILKTTIIKLENEFYFTFEDSELRILVPERYYGMIDDGMVVKVGVRPMDVYIGSHDSKGEAVKVAVFENLGDERRIGVHVGSNLFMLITAEEVRYKQGQSIKLEVSAEKTHLFDVNTGLRIRA